MRWRTISVKPGLIPSFLAHINVHPPLAVERVDLRPYMVFTVPHPSYSWSNSSAKHAEAVGPFATPSSSGLEQDKSVVVTRVSFVGAALLDWALVEFDLIGTAGLFIGKWCGHANTNSGRVTPRACRVVDPAEERALEPSQKCTYYTVLIPPCGLLSFSQTLGLGLQDLAFLFGFIVDLFKRDYPECFVQKAWVLPS
jgi:hypothetical protein